MGCDCHGWIELRDKKTGEWVSGSPIEGGRNYRWFGIIAGVRYDCPEMAKTHNRGIPKDASKAVKIEFESWGDDAHSPTWLDIKEISSAWRKFIDTFMEDLNEDQSLKLALAKTSGNLNNYRNKMEAMEFKSNGLPEHDKLDQFVDIYDDNYNAEYDRWYDGIRMVVWFDN